MTGWEYGNIYAVHTNQQDQGPVYMAWDRTGVRILEGCRDLISAANALGARGWIIDGRGQSLSTPDWMMKLTQEVEGFSPTTGASSYFMRRPSGSDA